MLFDYPERQLAYDQLRKEVEKRNYQARIMGMGAYSDGLLLAVDDFSDRSRSFVVHQRKRGWFLRLRDPIYFSIPTEAVLATCVGVLNQLELSTSQVVCESLRAKQNFAEVFPDQWSQDDAVEIDLHWRQHGWTPLSPEMEVDTWGTFENWYRNHVLPEKGKILGYSYSQGWDLSTSLDWPIDADENKLEAPLTLELLAILNTCNPKGFPLYALNRHHPSFLFDPRLAKSIATRNYWAVPFLPLDNDYFFISQCYSYGILGLYDPKRLLVFGDKLRILAEKLPNLLEDVRALP